jgi:hypothetical protein
MSVVHDDSLISEKYKLKCGRQDAISPYMTGWLALGLPNHVSQLGGDYPNAICVLTQIRLLRIFILRSVAVKACAIRVAYLLGIRKNFERSPRDDRGHISLHGVTERGNEPDRGLVAR